MVWCERMCSRHRGPGRRQNRNLDLRGRLAGHSRRWWCRLFWESVSNFGHLSSRFKIILPFMRSTCIVCWLRSRAWQINLFLYRGWCEVVLTCTKIIYYLPGVIICCESSIYVQWQCVIWPLIEQVLKVFICKGLLVPNIYGSNWMDEKVQFSDPVIMRGFNVVHVYLTEILIAQARDAVLGHWDKFSPRRNYCLEYFQTYIGSSCTKWFGVHLGRK